LEKILSISLILSHHHSHIHTSFLISLKQKHIEGGRKKNILYTLSLPLIITHIDTSRLYLYWKNKHKLEKEAKTKKKREKVRRY